MAIDAMSVAYFWEHEKSTHQSKRRDKIKRGGREHLTNTPFRKWKEVCKYIIILGQQEKEKKGGDKIKKQCCGMPETT